MYRVRSLAALLFLLAAGRSAAADLPLITASAGLDGSVRAGRWAPVRIEVDHKGPPIEGDLEVSWGDARVRRRFSLPSPGRRQYEVLVRTAEAASTVHVRLVSSEGMRELEVPVRPSPYDQPVVVCVGTAAPACSTSIAREDLPRSVRGYDAADRIVVAPGANLDRRQRVAIDTWRRLRALEDHGDFALTGQAARPMLQRGLPLTTRRVLAWGAAAYIGAVFLAGVMARARGTSLGRIGAAIGGLTFLGAALAMAFGRVGPASSVRVHHTALLQQISGSSESLLTLQAVAEFPSAGRFRLTLDTTDGVIETATERGRGDQLFDESGRPILERGYGLGQRQALQAEAIVDAQPLSLEVRGNRAVIANRSDRTAERCRFGEGIDGADIARLPPGGSVTGIVNEEGLGPIFTCVMPDLPIALNANDRPVQTIGRTSVAVYRQRRAADEASGASRIVSTEGLTEP